MIWWLCGNYAKRIKLQWLGILSCIVPLFDLLKVGGHDQRNQRVQFDKVGTHHQLEQNWQANGIKGVVRLKGGRSWNKGTEHYISDCISFPLCLFLPQTSSPRPLRTRHFHSSVSPPLSFLCLVLCPIAASSPHLAISTSTLL